MLPVMRMRKGGAFSDAAAVGPRVNSETGRRGIQLSGTAALRSSSSGRRRDAPRGLPAEEIDHGSDPRLDLRVREHVHTGEGVDAEAALRLVDTGEGGQQS